MRKTNREVAAGERFQSLCREAGVEATSRQVSKWRNKKGSLFKWLEMRRKEKVDE